eukprot:GHVU01128360.1.p1 GENE.GHVU01128360.1~~GHVU01128360.1.p1  ORF type:complete len:234 (+),score=31.61 GHVU01128360.1:629-1330(+)
MKHEEFEYEEELGRGGTGVVWRARHRPTNKEYAVKEYFGDVARRQQRSNPISRELAALRGLAGVPGVCRFVRYFEEQPVFASLVMELVPGDPLHIVFRRHLHDSSTPPVNIPPHPSREVPVDTPDRTLQDRGGEGAATTLTIVDFGSTVKFEDNAEGREDHRGGAGSIPVDEFTCTPHNTPPEAAHPSGSRMGPAADWWQLGVLTYEMIFGAPPFGYRDGDIDGMCGCVTSSA